MKCERYVVDSIAKDYPEIEVIAGIDLDDISREKEWERVHGYRIDMFINGVSVDVKFFGKRGTFISESMLTDNHNEMPKFIIACNPFGALSTKKLDIVPWKVVFDWCWQKAASSWDKSEAGTEGIYFANVNQSKPEYQKNKLDGPGIRKSYTFKQFVRKELTK